MCVSWMMLRVGFVYIMINELNQWGECAWMKSWFVQMSIVKVYFLTCSTKIVTNIYFALILSKEVFSKRQVLKKYPHDYCHYKYLHVRIESFLKYYYQDILTKRTSQNAEKLAVKLLIIYLSLFLSLLKAKTSPHLCFDKTVV